MQQAVIFDIDGTLADNIQRQKILKKDKHNWKEFFSNMGDDIPHEKVLELYRVIRNSGSYKMIIVTARPEEYKTITEQWLLWNGIEYDALYMRSSNDYRSDALVKSELLKKIQQTLSISFVFDDRSSVVKMWREAGLTCFQCFEHNY